jgi:hypothetical protein
VSATGDELYVDLPDDVAQRLADPPVTEKKLLELGVAWAGLSAVQAQLAELLRVFVITWDPLERLAVRPEGFATINIDADGSEIVVYVPVWSLVEAARAQRTTVGAVLAAMAGSAVVAAAARVVDATGEPTTPSGRGTRGRPVDDTGDLLASRAAGAALGTPAIRLVSPGWEDIGLGAITDIAQQAFGPVDLDRSPVELAPVVPPHAGCLACAGRRFGFPADLAEAQARMCPTHHAKTDTVIRTRLARASASNPDGWQAITGASARLGLPHLPGGLATRLAGAADDRYVGHEPAELAGRARLVVEAASWFPGRAHDFAVALGEEPDGAGLLPDWLVNLVLDLGRAGLGSEAAAVGEALAMVDPGLCSMLDGDVAVALARAGAAEQALAKVAENLTRWPRDVSIRMDAGEALWVLGDREGARTQLRVAVDLAEELDDFEGRAEAFERLDRLDRLERRDRPERPGSKPEPGRRPTTHHSKARGTRSRRRRGR